MPLPAEPFQWISNFTQVPNEFFEIAPYLTDPELRIMLYAIRHTIGWKARQESRSATMSVSTFANGYTYKGVQYEGTRLTEVTIRKALPDLVRLGLLEKVGEVTPAGQMWRLPEGCNTAALSQRADQWHERDQKRTVNGRKKAEEKRLAEAEEKHAEQGGYPITQEEGLSHNPGGGYPITQGEGYPITQGGVISQPHIYIHTENKNTERESPELLPLDDLQPLSPVGESHSGDKLSEQGQTLIDSAFAVEAQNDTSSQPTDVKQSVEKLPPPPAAAPKAERKPKRVPKPKTDPKPNGRNDWQEAMAYAFKEGYGGLAGRISGFFGATLKDEAKHRAWYLVQPSEQPATPQEVVALALWYSRNPDYAEHYAKKQGMPKTPAILRERLDEFRGAKGYAKAMELAGPIMDRLMKGEKLRPTPSDIKTTAAAPARESAQSYKRIQPTKTIDRREEGYEELAAEIFGV